MLLILTETKRCRCEVASILKCGGEAFPDWLRKAHSFAFVLLFCVSGEGLLIVR